MDQGGAIIPCDKTTINDNKLHTAFATIGAKYSATLSNDTLNGTFSQYGQTFSLTLTRNTHKKNPRLNRSQIPTPPFPYTTEEVTHLLFPM